MSNSQQTEQNILKAKSTDSTSRFPASHYPATPGSQGGTPKSVSHTPLNDRLPLPTPPYSDPDRPVRPTTPARLATAPTSSDTSSHSMYSQSGTGGPSRIPQNQTTAPNRSLDNVLNLTPARATFAAAGSQDLSLTTSPTQQSQSRRPPTRRIVTPAMTTDPLPPILQHPSQIPVDFTHDNVIHQEPEKNVYSGTFESTRQLHEAMGLSGRRAGKRVDIQAAERNDAGPSGGLMESFFPSEDDGGAKQLASVLGRQADSASTYPATSMVDSIPGPSTWEQTSPVETLAGGTAMPFGSQSTGLSNRTAQAVRISGDSRPVWSGVYSNLSQLPLQPETPNQYLEPSQTASAVDTTPNYWQAQQITPHTGSSSSSTQQSVPMAVPGSTYMLMAAQMAGRNYPTNFIVPNQLPYAYSNTSGGPFIPVQFMNTQEPNYQTFSPVNVYSRGINPREPHVPAPAQPTPLSKVATPNPLLRSQVDRIVDGARGSASAQMNLEPHEAALFSQLHGMDTPAKEPDHTSVSPANAWKECGDGILKEYSMMKRYHLAMRDLMRRSSEVFYQASQFAAFPQGNALTPGLQSLI
jgi:hypothetical protein